MKGVFIDIDGITHDVDVDIDTNEHGNMLCATGKITFVGQILHHAMGPIVCMTSERKGEIKNPHMLPSPLHDEEVYGPMMCIRMHGGVENDFTVFDYLTLF